jgi:CHAT domain-containing protein
LSQLLLGKVRQAGIGRLLIVPDGLLQYISFSALLLPAEDGSSPYLISQYEIMMLPSASALNTLRKAAEKRGPPTHTAAIVADPVVERDDPRVPHVHHANTRKSQERPSDLKMALRDIQAPEDVTRLPGSRAEARAIEQAFGAEDVVLALDFRASRDNILQGMLEHYRFVHFATHGIIDVRRPEMSGLVLSLVNERGQSQNGYLRLGDIYKLKLSADLVVLSACNSALGKELESEGIIGLPRGFLYAGGRSVIASLWKMEDEAAADFMKGLYARIKQGESPSAALRGTQLEMSQGRRWPQPFYWASFALQGDPQ